MIRFFQALGGCSNTVLSRVIARDMFNDKECVKVFSLISGGVSISLALAPILGGFLQTFFNWQAAFLVLGISSSLFLIGTYFLIGETLPVESRQSVHIPRLLANYKKIIKDKYFVGYTAAITLSWAGYFSFLSGSSFVFINLMKVSPQKYGILYGIIILGL